MAVPVQDLRQLLDSAEPGAALVHVEGRYVVAGSAELDTPELRGALSVVTREELLERAGGQPVAERDLEEIAAALAAAVDNRGG
ncbi:hypothetical protein [Nocardia sp. NRRL S-836]|uniref:hypothetical protein n=1 Tax=Nocardia sp. NRRL S-836 TaxID=1519492 RepID=UPI0006AEABBA|nr:hypothetical protein [Nocardia sp. NRRL S-836]KOV90022.1 hypothetical protein ADL03_01225 [Nocardia sp. NRRL S-836]